MGSAFNLQQIIPNSCLSFYITFSLFILLIHILQSPNIWLLSLLCTNRLITNMKKKNILNLHYSFSILPFCILIWVMTYLKCFLSSKSWVLDKKLSPPLALKLFDNWLGTHFHDIFHFLNKFYSLNSSILCFYLSFVWDWQNVIPKYYYF